MIATRELKQRDFSPVLAGETNGGVLSFSHDTVDVRGALLILRFLDALYKF
jgi:hypothetical protein